MVITRRSTAFATWAEEPFGADENSASLPVASTVRDHVYGPQLKVQRVVSRIERKESVPPAQHFHEVAMPKTVEVKLIPSNRSWLVHREPASLQEGGRAPLPLDMLPQPGRMLQATRRERSHGLATTENADHGCDDLKDDYSADDCDNWKIFEVRLNKYYEWHALPSGIFDLRLGRTMRTSEGVKLMQAYVACMQFLRQQDADFKIGMASSLATRWLMYKQPDNKWNPSHLGILMEIQGRVAAGMAESALIAMISSTDMPALYNINWKNGDKGGTGPRDDDLLYSTYYVYVAVNAAYKFTS